MLRFLRALLPPSSFCRCPIRPIKIRPIFHKLERTLITATLRIKYLESKVGFSSKMDKATLHSDESKYLMVFEDISNKTLTALAEYLEALADEGICPPEFDVELSSGVLTVKIGDEIGTYVINKQTPNRQIWLSSPLSGPKRYDLVNDHWVYSHDGVEMLELLSREFSQIFQRTISASDLQYNEDYS